MNPNPNYLFKTRAYLVGAMSCADGSSWRSKVEQSLKEMGVIVLNPYNHPFVNSCQEDNDATNKLKKMIALNQYDEASAMTRKIRTEDLRCVDISDFIFCYLNPKVPTCGSYEELFESNRSKKPIFLSIDGGKKETPLWLFGTIPHKYIYDNVDDAIEMLKKIDNGTVAIDSERWRLLRKEFR